MDTAQRLNRGFHRLALFLAAISLLAGGVVSVFFASLATSNAKRWHDKQVALVCAQDAFYRKFYADLSREEFDRRVAAKLAPIQAGEVKVTDPDLKELGCVPICQGRSRFSKYFAPAHRVSLAGRGTFRLT